MTANFFDCVTILKFGKAKPVKRTLQHKKQQTLGMLMQNNQYLVGHLDEVIATLLLIFPEMGGYGKYLKDSNNKLISLRKGDVKLLEKLLGSYCNNRYIKTKIRTDHDKIYTIFRGLNVAEDGAKYEFFTIISSDSLLVDQNNYYLQDN